MVNKKIRHLFARCIVSLSLVMCVMITLICMRDWWITCDVDADSLESLLRFWGVELFLLCLKRIFGDRTPVNPLKKNKTTSTPNPEVDSI